MWRYFFPLVFRPVFVSHSVLLTAAFLYQTTSACKKKKKEKYICFVFIIKFWEDP